LEPAKIGCGLYLEPAKTSTGENKHVVTIEIMARLLAFIADSQHL